MCKYSSFIQGKNELKTKKVEIRIRQQLVRGGHASLRQLIMKNKSLPTAVQTYPRMIYRSKQ